MDAAAAAKRRRAGSLLPEVTSKRGRSSQNSRAKPDNESLHTSSEWDESAQVASKREIALFRNSLKQNVCVRMLQEGNHRSFSELFYLLQAERDRRAAAEPSSALSSELRPLLEEQREKLETVRLHMCEAEQAERTGSWPAMCEHRLFLGQFFSAPEDQLLSLHFFHSCADREQGRSSRPATEARACMAELYLQQGELEEARQQAELCIRQAEDGGWLDLSGRPLRLRARQTLWRIYDQLAVAPMDAANYSEALELLHKGYSMATESDDKQIEGEAAHRLGLAYQRTGDHNTAKKFFNTYMQICVTMNDAGGIGKAYKAMAKSMESACVLVTVRGTWRKPSVVWRSWSTSLESTGCYTTWRTPACYWATSTAPRVTTSGPLSSSSRVMKYPVKQETCLCSRKLRCWWLALVLSPCSGRTAPTWCLPRPAPCGGCSSGRTPEKR
ncbi:tetratricopeptide repeat protein 29 isoform X4 [Scophthalmus maximus]|uniref:tetratricopeptide repeat protein 29 isoform X4 n=1 Tax=Scophthalmus maximus TaxID=52904 RepID=UPI001FA8BDA7|nr:tetratricopeptide repeat protein 29 isoform X4 [Scophthalmus maximus]